MKFIGLGARRLRERADIKEGVITYLHEQLGITQIGIRDQIIVRAPDDDEVRYFSLPDDGRIPVVVIYRSGFMNGEKGPTPFRLTVTVFPADRNQFVINAGQVDDALADPIATLPSAAEFSDSYDS